MDRVLVRMPEQFDYVIPALSVAQSYVAHQMHLLSTKQKNEDSTFVIDCADESHLFFAPMLPRLEVTVMGDSSVARADWENVLDMRDIKRPLQLARATQKPLTEMWGIMFGSSPRRMPALAYLGFRQQEPQYDILLDMAVDQGYELHMKIMDKFPEVTIMSENLTNRRPAYIFDAVNNAKMFIGKRSGASYVAALLGKALLEVYPRDIPSWFLNKGMQNNYIIYHEDTHTAEDLWVGAKRLCETFLGTSCHTEMLMAQ